MSFSDARAIRTLRILWSEFVTSGRPGQFDPTTSRRVRFINLFALVTILTVVTFGVVNLFSLMSESVPANGIMELAFAVMDALVILYLRKGGNLPFAANAGLLATALCMTYLTLTGGMGGTGILWWFCLPPAAFYLVGRRRGWWWIGATSAVILALFLDGLGGIGLTPYPAFFLRQFLAAYLVVSLLTFAYEVTRDNYEARLGKQAEEVRSANRNLLREMERRRRVQADLEVAKAEAERANRAKSEFLSRMSHELRTPMNAILGFSQLLESDEREPLTPGQRESVSAIIKGGRHLLGLINEVLDLARIESGRIEVDLQPVDLAASAAEVCRSVRPLAEEKGLTLTTSLPEANACWVSADPHRLRQILLNLLSNAIKYNRKGGFVRLEVRAGEGGRWMAEVVDGGPGIAAEDQPRLFEAFQRLSADRLGIEGTGIGLAISRQLAELMGGSMSFASAPGEGSRFSVVLPGASPPEAAESRAEEAGASGSGPSRLIGTVLYVEDDLSNLGLVRQVLKRRPGISLLHAAQGNLGFELARAQRPDLVLLDLHLPDIHGLEVLERLRLDGATRGIPVVVVSATAMPGEVDDVLARGVSGYLTKPLDIRRFLETLDVLLEAGPRRAGGAGMGGAA